MCTVLLPPGDNPIAVNKYIISFIKFLYPIRCCNSSSAGTARYNNRIIVLSFHMHDEIRSVRRVHFSMACYDPVLVGYLNRWPFVSVLTHVFVLKPIKWNVRSIVVALISQVNFLFALIKTCNEARVLPDCVTVQWGRQLKGPCLLSNLKIHKIMGRWEWAEK
jgi:hypothetical protein